MAVLRRSPVRPPPAQTRLVVAADGTGDFNTIQGAFDFVPDNNPRRVTIFVKNGRYEEIVYFRNKTNVTLTGEDRERVEIVYNNSEIFNPHPPNVATNEWPGTFPSRRAAFMADRSRRHPSRQSHDQEHRPRAGRRVCSSTASATSSAASRSTGRATRCR
jgi:pectin methylesterase-like acyl-CoA thioesterase